MGNIFFTAYAQYILDNKENKYSIKSENNSKTNTSLEVIKEEDELIYIIEEAVNNGILLYNNIKTYFSQDS